MNDAAKVSDGIQFVLLREGCVVEPTLEDGSPVYLVPEAGWLSVQVMNLPSDQEIHLEVTRPNGGKASQWVRDRKPQDVLATCINANGDTPCKHTLHVSQQVAVEGTTAQRALLNTFEFAVRVAA